LCVLENSLINSTAIGLLENTSSAGISADDDKPGAKSPSEKHTQKPAEEPVMNKHVAPELAKTSAGKPVEHIPANISPAERNAEELLAKKLEDENIHEVKALLAHKVSDNEPGRILIEVEWADDPKTTWEPEEELQDGASEMLYDYWKKQGGRNAALFENGSQPLLKEQYWVYKIIQHERVRSIFQLQIQWVGYPADAANTTWEPESKVKNIANEMLQAYWVMKGGRDQYLAKRGRNKKARAD
jgi:hypothetical protein